MHPLVTQYLENRGLPVDVADAYDVTYGEYSKGEHRLSGRLEIPIAGYGGEFVGISGRALSEDMQPKYWIGHGFSKKRWVYGLQTKRRSIPVLVEGQTDVWALWDLGYAAYATMGSDCTDWQAAHIAAMSRVCLVYPDADMLAVRWATALSRLGVQAVIPAVPYPSDIEPEQRRKADACWLHQHRKQFLADTMAATVEYARTLTEEH